MSKGSGMGRKRMSVKSNKGMDKCNPASQSKQCGRQKNVTKGKNLFTPKENT